MEDLRIVQEEIEKEREEMEQRRYAPPPPSRWQVTLARWAWGVGTVALDAYTAWIFATMTTPFYGVLWIAIGAGGLIYWDLAANRIGNNDEQDKIAADARIVSVLAIAIMAVIAGALLLSGVRFSWTPVAIEVVAVGLFVYHMVQLYRYYDADDERRAQKEDALAEMRSLREIAAADRAARRVKAKLERVSRDQKYRQQYGGAYDAARGNGGSVRPPAPVRQFGSPPPPIIEKPRNPHPSSPSETEE